MNRQRYPWWMTLWTVLAFVMLTGAGLARGDDRRDLLLGAVVVAILTLQRESSE